MLVLLASSNRGKVKELELLLPDWIEIKTADELGVTLPPETGTTFLENALLKARAAERASGLISIADDSGLEVDALDDAPGVRSARFAGDHATDAENNALLLNLLREVKPAFRTARFRSVVAVVAPDGTEIHDEGAVEGRILESEKGRGGFGYDPLFVPEGFERTFAELSLDQKNKISHRGKAFRNVARRLVPFLEKHRTTEVSGA